MKIDKLVEDIKKMYEGYGHIDDSKARDQVLYGNTDQECTGVVVSCWASVGVIEEAIEKGANLIISHEALFWNHGDHTEWLEESNNKTYLKKKELLEKHNIVVWRNHDYVHSGINIEGAGVVDGIFYGMAKELGWTNNIEKTEGIMFNPRSFELEETTVEDIANLFIDRLNVNGVKVIGDLNQKVKRISIIPHILGDDNEVIKIVEKEDYDLLLAMELIDFTFTEYIHDTSLLGLNKSIMTIGHFNLEEPGMKFMSEYLSDKFTDLDVSFVASGDMYQYVTK